MYFAPQTSKPGYGPGFAKIVSAIRIFCFEVYSASRCSITSKFFLYITIRGALGSILGGGRIGLIRHCLSIQCKIRHDRPADIGRSTGRCSQPVGPSDLFQCL